MNENRNQYARGAVHTVHALRIHVYSMYYALAVKSFISLFLSLLRLSFALSPVVHVCISYILYPHTHTHTHARAKTPEIGGVSSRKFYANSLLFDQPTIASVMYFFIFIFFNEFSRSNVYKELSSIS